MKDKIIKILRKELWTAFRKGQGVSPLDADNSEFWAPLFDLNVAPRVASDIEAIINENYVPKEFIEWMGRVGISYITHAYRKENKGKYQRVILKEDNEFEITQYTLDELFEYWKTQIRDK